MTCISTLPAYQTGYHLYDLRPEILVNPYQAAQVWRNPVSWSIRCSVVTQRPDGLGLSTTLHSGLRLHQNITSDNIPQWVFFYRRLP
jgi:hypothetical protein